MKRTALSTLLALVLLGAAAPPLLAQSGSPVKNEILQMINGVGEMDDDGVRHVDVGQAEALLRAHPEIVVVDVRTSAEFRGGHIAEAEHLNYFWLSFRRRVRDLDPERVYLVHCRSGHRSAFAAPLMREEGLKNVLHLDGGMSAWKEAGLPVVVVE